MSLGTEDTAGGGGEPKKLNRVLGKNGEDGSVLGLLFGAERMKMAPAIVVV